MYVSEVVVLVAFHGALIYRHHLYCHSSRHFRTVTLLRLTSLHSSPVKRKMSRAYDYLRNGRGCSLQRLSFSSHRSIHWWESPSPRTQDSITTSPLTQSRGLWTVCPISHDIIRLIVSVNGFNYFQFEPMVSLCREAFHSLFCT